MWTFNRLNPAFILNFIKSKKNKSISVRQQLLLTYKISVFGIIITLIANLTGITGPQETEPLIYNLCYLIATITVAILYSAKKLKLHKAFSVITLTTHTFTCNEMLHCAISGSHHEIMLILANVAILVINTIFAIFFYLKKIPSILSALSILTYIACTIITGDSNLKEFSLVMVNVFIILAVLGHLLVKHAYDLHSENWFLKKEDEALLDILKLEKEQMHAYIELAKKRQDETKTAQLLDLLSDEARMNIINNVKEAITAREIANRNIAKIFPELSPSEIEICELIINGKKINEISNLLKKSESNITCQRTNIRRKLALQPKDNLNEFLKARFEGCSESKEKETAEKFSIKNFRR